MNAKYTEKELEEYHKYRTLLTSSISRSISSSIIQLFYDDTRGKPKAAGSCILFSIDNKHFAISAAHVIAEHTDTTYVIIGKDGISLGGQMYSVKLPSTK